MTTTATPPKTHRKRLSRYRLSLVRETTETYDALRRSGKITSTQDACKVIPSIVRSILGDSPCERFVIVTLDTKHKPIGVHEITVGTLDASLVHPREVFAPAILDTASSIILCHNHPSGDPAPSREDHQVTTRLTDVGKMLGIHVLDHIIVAWDENDECQTVSIREQ